MKTFSFRLQTKLDLSRNQEQSAKEKLMTCIAELEKLTTEQKKIRRRITAIEENIRCLSQENKFDQKALINNEYLQVLNDKDKALAERILEANHLVDEARRILMEIRKETNGLEKLKGRKWDEYVHEANLEEQKNLDESAMNGFLRKNKKA